MEQIKYEELLEENRKLKAELDSMIWCEKRLRNNELKSRQILTSLKTIESTISSERHDIPALKEIYIYIEKWLREMNNGTN